MKNYYIFTQTKKNCACCKLILIFLLLFCFGFINGQTVTTDKADYLPGEIVTITGSGWLAGETVELKIDHQTFDHPTEYLSAIANTEGKIFNNEYEIQEWDLGETFLLTATGQTSGDTATWIFTDAGGDYTFDFSAYDPELYLRKYPGEFTSLPTQRASSPLFPTNHSQTVESLEPSELGLGQIVAFEFYLTVKTSGVCYDDVIEFTGRFATETTSNNNFGFDPSYGIYAAFVDLSADGGLIDPDGDASVTNFVTSLGSGYFDGTIEVSGLDPGDVIPIEVWVVLKNTIPVKVNGNVQTSLQSAQTLGFCAPNEAISTGNQTVPLNQVGDFDSVDADLSVTKNADPVCFGENITYNISVTNLNDAITNYVVANQVVITDVLGVFQNFVSATDPYSIDGQTVTFNVGPLEPQESKTFEIVVHPTQPGTVANTATVSALTDDPNMTNNTAITSTEVYANPTCVIENFGDVTFYEGDDGYINLIVSGGTPPYIIAWEGPNGYTSSDEDISNLEQGNYVVYITDANGCTTFCEQTINAPQNAPECQASPTAPTCHNGDDGEIFVNWSNFSTSVDIYLIDSESNSTLKAENFGGTEFTIENLSPDAYTVRIVDDNSLQTTCSATVPNPDVIEIDLVCSNTVNEPACQTQAEIDASFALWINGFSVEGGTEPLDITYTVNGDEVANLDVVSPPSHCGGKVIINIDVIDFCGETANCSRTFTVLEDLVLPVISTLAESGDLGCNPTVEAPEFTGLDNCDGEFTPVVTTDGPQLTSGDDLCTLYSQTWTANYTDECLNAAVPVSITYTWTEAPQIKAFCSDQIAEVPMCATPEEIDLLFAAWKDGFYFTGGCNAMDNKDELLALDWRDSFDEYTGGTVSFTYKVWDICSEDEVTCEFYVPQCVVNCETAYGRLEDADGESLGDCFLENGFNRWGWSNMIVESETDYVLPLYAGAAHCDPANGWGMTGTVTINYYNGEMVITYSTLPDYSLSEVHIYAGCEMFPVIKGKPTVAPGQYTHNATGLDRGYEYTVTFTGVEGPVYVIAHAVVCDIRGISSDDAGLVVLNISCAEGDGGEESEVAEKVPPGLINKDKISKVKVYPNPFKDKVTFEFVSGKNARAHLEITNVLGQRIAVLMDENVREGVMNRIEYKPVDVVSGVLIYRLMLDDNINAGRLIYKE